MKKLLLVHGAWHNESCWDKVKQELEKKGYSAESVTIAGNDPGETEVNTSYRKMVDSVAAKAREMDEEFIMVGHSSAGHIIQHAAPESGDKLKKIIFNNAWLLPCGKSQFDLVPEEIKNGMRAGASQHPRNCIPMDEGFLRNVLASDAPADVQDTLLSLLVPQPLMMMEHKAETEAFEALDVPVAFLHSKDDVSLPPDVYKNMFLGLGKEQEMVEITGAHESLFTDPEGFTAGLLKLL